MTAPAGDLLLELIRHPLDPGYQAAADRRAAAGESESGQPAAGAGWRTRTLTAIGALLLGLLLTVAYQQERRSEPAQSAANERLADEIRSAQKVNDSLQDQAAALAGSVRTLRDQAADPAQQQALTALEDISGDRAVQGPGLTVRLADVPSASASSGIGSTPSRSNIPGSYPQDLIGDRELRDVINALWAGGAEAISINNIRLTATSAIRFAGQVVLVDFQPVTSPYTIKAIGDRNALDVAFVGGDVGARLSTLASAGRLEFSVDTADNLQLPASAQAEPTLADPGSAAPAPTGSTPTGATTTGATTAGSATAGSATAGPTSQPGGSSGSTGGASPSGGGSR